MDNVDVVLLVILIAFSIIILFFALRYVLLWYWKIDTRVKHLEKIVDLLEKIVDRMPYDINLQRKKKRTKRRTIRRI